MTLGRHGLFLNNSMDDNVLLGMQIADHIDGERRPTAAPGCHEMLAFMNLRFAGEVTTLAMRRPRRSSPARARSA